MYEVYPIRDDGLDVPVSVILRMFNVSNETLLDIVNFSLEDFVNELRNANSEKWLDRRAETLLIAVYVLIGIIGVVGNILLVFLIAKSPNLRTARNIYIANLAVSDLTLCVICMPFTLLQLIKRDWQFGMVVCKMVPTFQATNVFVSTFSYSAIAIDRYKVIVYHIKKPSQIAGSFLVITSIWILALLFAIPMTLYTDVKHVEFMGIDLYRKCLQQWPSYTMSRAYTVSVMLIQYVAPVIIVSVCYAKITLFLKYHRLSMNTNAAKTTVNPIKLEKARRRTQRTTNVLVAIAAIFVISWLPLNIYNLIADFNYELLTNGDKSGNVIQAAYLAFAVCHAIAMSSACWNPLLYGWLNSTMKAEITLLCKRLLPCLPWDTDVVIIADAYRSYRFNELSVTPSAVSNRQPDEWPSSTNGDVTHTEMKNYGNFLTVPSSCHPTRTTEISSLMGNGSVNADL